MCKFQSPINSELRIAMELAYLSAGSNAYFANGFYAGSHYQSNKKLDNIKIVIKKLQLLKDCNCIIEKQHELIDEVVLTLQELSKV